MLLEFQVSNFRSILEEQAISTKSVPKLGDTDDSRPRILPGIDGAHLPAISLYGANASGKSNFLKALLFMRDAVLGSYRVWEPDSGVPRDCFAWGGRELDSLFEVEFVAGGTRYQYGFRVDDERVKEEWLSSFLSGKEQMWFERDEQQFEFGSKFTEGAQYESLTGSNSLLLSSASQSRNQAVWPVYLWFRAIGQLNIDRFSPAASRYPSRHSRVHMLLAQEPEALNQIQKRQLIRFRELLKASDFGILDMKVDDSGVSRNPAFLLKHQVDHDNPWLPLREESNGTRTMFSIALTILRAIDDGAPLLFDELETSLHPLLAIEIIKLFNDPARNPKHAQLIFTTHDSNLLGRTLGEPVLRRDQVFLTEKENSSGQSCVYSLTDFSPRKSENVERGYLQGRYGAIPFLGSFSEFDTTLEAIDE